MLSLKKYILDQVARRALSQQDARQLLGELSATAKAATPDAAATPPAVPDTAVAIVGMAGRFPQARDAEAFWQLLRRGLNCIRGYPEARHADFAHILRNPHYTEFLIGDAIAPEQIAHAHAPAGYLDDIDRFDAALFGIPPAEATFMDPYQRIALEVAHEAIEDAGYGGNTLRGSRTGIYIGKEGTNYSLYRYCSVKDGMQLTGSWESIMASRIAYLFNFRGPAMVVDTACSAGLVAIHMAAAAIAAGECDAALAGGINLSVTGEFATRFQGGMAMDAVESGGGLIRTFDARADGTVWGEGAALVMLKPLARALADGDAIHAVIRGSAINNDGASNGLTAPNADAQEEVITAAWQKAGVAPETLAYVEAHGTGTVLGDPIEFKALTNAFRRHTARRQFCAIGSLKTNMGHLVAASGVASLFKVVKSLEHREMAPTINFSQPNPYINFVGSPLYVNDAVRPWPADDAGVPRRAALSSFGFSHTNCHMVVEEAPARAELPALRAAYCLPLSGQTAEVLADYVERLRRHCDRAADFNLADLCFTLATGRGHHAHRLAIVAASADELRVALARATALLAAGGGADAAGICIGQHQVVSERRKQRAAGEITDTEKKALTDAATAALSRVLAGDTAALAELSRAYADGANVDWPRCYAGEPRRRVAAPTYPMQRQRVWAAPKLTKIAPATAAAAAATPRLHPLLDHLAPRDADGRTVYESTFGIDSHWVLADHRIVGHAVVPGTTYIEMARAAAQAARGWQRLALREVFFVQPMVVGAGEQRRVRVVLDALGDDSLGFAIESRRMAAADAAAGGADGDDDAAEWLRHAEGRIEPIADDLAGGTATPDASGAATTNAGSASPASAEPPPLDLAALRAAADETIEVQSPSDTGVFQFGPHWDVLRAAWRIGDRALARLELPAAFTGELAALHIHPAMLDNAVNLTSQTHGATYLPFSYGSYRVLKAFTPTLYALVTPKPAAASAEMRGYDVLLADESGAIVGEIRDYLAKKVTRFDFDAAPADALLAPRWVPVAATAGSVSDGAQVTAATARVTAGAGAGAGAAAVAPAVAVAGAVAVAPAVATAPAATAAGAAAAATAPFAKPSYDAAPQPGHWLLLGEAPPELLASFAARDLPLRHRRLTPDAGEAASDAGCVLASAEGFAALTAGDALRGAAGVLFAGDLHAADTLADADSFVRARRLGVDALFALVKALVGAKLRLPGGLAVLTRGAFDAVGGEAINPLAAASAALATVAAAEYAQLPCRIVDTADAADLHDLAARLAGALPGRPLALRGGRAFEQELAPLALDDAAADAPLTLHGDGVYLVTGGLGGLGLATARWLAGRGRIHLVLAGRSALPPRAQWRDAAAQPERDPRLAQRCAALLEIEPKLASLDYAAVDVGDADQVAALLDALRARHGRIRGVFHLAGVAGDGFLMLKDAARFDAVLRPKLDGARHLYALTAVDRPELFVLFSSITALLGGQGQGDYAAANAFLDALASHAARAGRPLLAVNWPGWADAGMAVDFGIAADQMPFAPIVAADAFAQLERLLAAGVRRALPGVPNLALLGALQGELPIALGAELQRRIARQRVASQSSTAAAAAGQPVQVRGKADDELSDCERSLCAIYAGVLGLAEIDVFANFQDLGGNSIIATHLLKRIDASFPGLVDISDVFAYPSIDEMAAAIDERRAPAAGTAAPAPAPAVAAPAPARGAWADAIDRLLDGEQSIDALVDQL